MTATGLIANRRPIIIPGLQIQNFIDLAALMLKLPEDGTGRTTAWIRSIVDHTTKGIWPQPLKDGYGPPVDDAAKVNRYWTNNDKAGGSQFVADRDGDFGSMCDCFKIAAYHAGKPNQYSQGLEIFQEQVYVDGVKTGPLYIGQLNNCVTLHDALTWLGGNCPIQRQVQEKYVGAIPRLIAGGADAVGVYGHRDCSTNRGRGDPGDHIYEYLMRDVSIPAEPDIGRPAQSFKGYEPVNYLTKTDLALWKARQTEMNKKFNAKLKVDGIAGPATCAAIKKNYPDKPRGLWIVRPLDDVLAATFGNDFDISKAA